MTRLDGNTWASYFRNYVIPKVNAFCDAVCDRVLPAFAPLEDEAEKAAQAELDRLEMQYFPDENGNSIEHAQRALEVGLSHYELMCDVRQSILNLATVALYHMHEQQLLYFHRKQLLHPSEEDCSNMINLKKLKSILMQNNIELEQMTSWSTIHELELVANVVKHAQGRSSQELWALRPELFTRAARGGCEASLPSMSVYTPLTGEDILISYEDVRKYQSAIVSFWLEFAASLATPKI
jgi:hypothetical protein